MSRRGAEDSGIPGFKALFAALIGSFLCLSAAESLADCQPVADFKKHKVGVFPDDWKLRDGAPEFSRVMERDGVRFVRTIAESARVRMEKRFEWDLEQSPVLRWRWRPHVFPEGSDERVRSTNDSVLGVYALFPNGPWSVKTIKYVWSLKAPIGALASTSTGRTRMIVIRSGPPRRAGWSDEAVNVAYDYQRLFGGSPKQPLGIALLTDADDTKQRAVGDYASFRVCTLRQSAKRAGAGLLFFSSQNGSSRP